jgi:serine/threonine protein phosphatase PrpC
MKLRSWGVSDIGRRRAHNEDYFLIDEALSLFVVADGMGGLDRGDIASRMACERIREHVVKNPAVLETFRADPNLANREKVLATLETATQQACADIFAVADAHNGRGMGTTLEVLLLCDGIGFTAHVGDSRIYLFRNGRIHQLTEDHSLVQEKVKQGLITKEEARTARRRNVITRAVGVLPNVKVDTLAFEVDQGDCFLLCSDGLHQYFSDQELQESVAQVAREEAAQTLVELANERGGSDNVTGVFLEVVTSIPREFWDKSTVKMETLSRMALFRYLTYRELVAVSGIADYRSVPSGQVLFREGDEGDELFLLLTGRVSIVKNKTVIVTLESGDHFGEMALLDQPRRSAHAVVEREAAFLVIRRADFYALMKRNSVLAVKLLWNILLTLSSNLRSTSAQLANEATGLPQVPAEMLEWLKEQS